MVSCSATMFARAVVTILIVCGVNCAADPFSWPAGEVIGTSNYADRSLRAAGPREELVYRRIAAPLNSMWICLHFIKFGVAPQTAFKVFVNGKPEVSMVYSSYPKPNVQCFEADYIQIFYNGFISESGFIIVVAAPDPQHDDVSYHNLEDKNYLAEPEHSTKLEVLSPGVYSGERFDVVSEAGEGYGANQLLSWRFSLPASPVGLQWICLHFSRFSTQFNKDKLLVFTDDVQQSLRFSGSRKPFSVCRQSSQLNMVFTSEEALIEGGVLGFVTYSRVFYEAPKRVHLSPIDDETIAGDVLLRNKRARYSRTSYRKYYYSARYYKYLDTLSPDNGLAIGLGIGIPAILITIIVIIVCLICCNRQSSTSFHGFRRDTTNSQVEVVYNAITGQTQSNVATNPTAANVATNPTAANVATNPTAANVAINPTDANVSTNPTAANVATNPTAANVKTYPTAAAYPLTACPIAESCPSQASSRSAPYPTGTTSPYPSEAAALYPSETAPAEPSSPPPPYSDVCKAPI